MYDKLVQVFNILDFNDVVTNTKTIKGDIGSLGTQSIPRQSSYTAVEVVLWTIEKEVLRWLMLASALCNFSSNTCEPIIQT